LKLVKEQKKCPVDSDLAIWMVDLAKTYQNYPNQRLRLGCLERACYICELTYGRNRKGFWDAMLLLTDYYIDHGQIDSAVKTVATVTAEQEKRFGKHPAALGDAVYRFAIKCESEYKYNQAKQLGLAVLNLAKDSSNPLSYGLPAFYCLLGMNNLASGRP